MNFLQVIQVEIAWQGNGFEFLSSQVSKVGFGFVEIGSVFDAKVIFLKHRWNQYRGQMPHHTARRPGHADTT